MAKIDESLVLQSRVRHDIQTFLLQRDYRGLFDPDLHALCEEVQGSAAVVIQALFSLLLDEVSPVETYAFLVLKGVLY